MLLFPIRLKESNTTVAVAESVFSDAECDAIIAQFEPQVTAGELSGGYVDKTLRVSQTSSVNHGPDTNWIYERFLSIIQKVNAEFQYNIIGMTEPVQFASYENGGKFGWHVDCGRGSTSCRKISISAQLSAPDAYTGGDLELLPGREPYFAPRKRGSVTAFASFVVHRVTPVTGGKRCSLVSWVAGPPFA